MSSEESTINSLLETIEELTKENIKLKEKIINGESMRCYFCNEKIKEYGKCYPIITTAGTTEYVCWMCWGRLDSPERKYREEGK